MCLYAVLCFIEQVLTLACTCLSLLAGSQGTIVGLVTRQWPGRLWKLGLVPGRDKRFCSSETRLALDHTQLAISSGMEWPGLMLHCPLLYFVKVPRMHSTLITWFKK
jgi:hypothetical protein